MRSLEGGTQAVQTHELYCCILPRPIAGSRAEIRSFHGNYAQVNKGLRGCVSSCCKAEPTFLRSQTQLIMKRLDLERKVLTEGVILKKVTLPTVSVKFN
jgi:hypothetical protein